MKSSNIFVTGCDEKNKWMLPWIIENFEKYHGDENDLYIVDFDQGYPELDGWFKKPQIMLEASQWADKVCWIDTDCEIRGNLNGIFDYVQEGKITIAVDQPWSTRRPERGRWFNSGVVAYTGRPAVLREWARIIWEKKHNEVGDQEVLNWMLGGDPLRELTHICLLYTSPSPRDVEESRMPSSA